MPIDNLQPIEKMQRIRGAIATIEDMLVCLSAYDGRPVDKVMPRLMELRKAVDNFTAEHI
jgi:hypothetical protein